MHTPQNTHMGTPASLARLMLALGLAFLGLSGAACAANPADDVPSAVVGDPVSEAVDTEEEAQDDTMGEEEGDDEAMGEDEEESDMAGEGEAEGAPMAEAIALEGTISFTGSKVTGSHSCVFQDWQGALDPGEGSAETASLSFAVETASIFCDEGSRNDFTERFEGHLRDPDFFWSEMHPEATFASTSIVEGGEGEATHTISGDLTIRGITQAISFPAVVTVTEDAVTGVAEFSVDRQQWEISYEGKPDDLIRDEVVIAIDLSGQR